MTRYTAPEDFEGERLDVVLAEAANISRSKAHQWILAGHAAVDGAGRKPSHRVAPGETVTWVAPPADDDRIVPTSGELDVLFEDDQLIVLDKPSGLTVHPGAGHTEDTLAHRLLHRFPEISGVGGPGRPGIVHRLDKDTTGVLVIARTAAAYDYLAAAFAERRVQKTYLAVVYGTPDPSSGAIEQPIGRHRSRRKEMTVRPDGRKARTGYRTLVHSDGLSVLELDLHTGRTHQIRVHLKWAKHPLVGDPVYGEARHRGLPRDIQKPARTFPRPALHAHRLRFRHPERDEEMRFEAPVPADLVDLWTAVTASPWPQ